MDLRALPAPAVTEAIRRGVCRLLYDMGYAPLIEFRLTNGRRLDVVGLSDAGAFAGVEIKSTVADWRGDRKWPDYLAFCDRFYFAVPPGFPEGLLPVECGLIVADSYGAAVRRAAPPIIVNPTRKRRQLVRFAHAAASRLHRRTDPMG